MAARVTIVLPTFNRARFLPAAFDAIRHQHFTDWDLVVIDDGSTDETQSIVDAIASRLPQPVQYVFQANQGAYGARNTGVDRARGRYVAFYDSDDVWLPHHLSTCVQALDACDDLDWVYGATTIVDFESQRTISASSFYDDGRPKAFLSLRRESCGPARRLDKAGAIRGQIRDGLYCGLQNSVLRRTVFERLRFATDLRNEAEDQLFAIRALSAGFSLGCIDDVLVRYHVHAGNSSASAKDQDAARQRKVFEPLVAGYARLASEVPLTPPEHRELKRRISRELFWSLGYAGLWSRGDRAGAVEAYSRALRYWPWSPREWKTYILARLRMLVSRATPADKARAAR